MLQKLVEERFLRESERKDLTGSFFVLRCILNVGLLSRQAAIAREHAAVDSSTAGGDGDAGRHALPAVRLHCRVRLLLKLGL